MKQVPEMNKLLKKICYTDLTDTFLHLVYIFVLSVIHVFR